MQFFRFSALLCMVIDLHCMQPHDLMYALHIVSLHIHNNRHAQKKKKKFIFGTILTQFVSIL